MLGTAHIHVPDYLAVLAADPRVRLSAVYAGDARWRHPIPTGMFAQFAHYSDAAEALRHVDAALIASTTAEHEEMLDAVLKAGVPALIEKPLAASAERARRMPPLPSVSAAMFLRRAPAVRRLRELYADGVVGDAREVSVSFSHSGLDAGFFTGSAAWMLDPECGAVGGFADLGIHLIDLVHWLLPAAEPECPATVVRAALRHRAGLPLDIGGDAVLDWSGASVAVHAAWNDNPGGLHIGVRGALGTLAVHDSRLEIELHGEPVPRVERYPPHRASAALEAFIDDLCQAPGTSRDRVNARELVAHMELLDQIYNRAGA